MAINDAGDLKTLSAIEDQLTRIEDSFLSGAPSDRAASGAMLYRQAELLVEKSKLFLAHGNDATRYNGMIHDYGLLNVLSGVPSTRAALHQASEELKARLR